MNRRSFISNSSLAMMPFLLNGFPLSIFGSTHPAYALAADLTGNDNILVIIQLFGGNDGLNTIVPVNMYDRYYHARKNIAINEKKLLKIKGHSYAAMHPAFASCLDLFNEDKLAIIQSAGYSNQDFSHFKSSDIWMSAQDTTDHHGRTGWMARYLEQQSGSGSATTHHPPAVQIGSASSLLFRGELSSFCANVSSPDREVNLSSAANDEHTGKYASAQISFLKKIAEETNLYSRSIKTAADKTSGHSPYPDNNPLAQQLKIVSKLIRGGLQTKIYMVSFDGFDTHAQQAEESDPTKGRHADLLKTTADAIAAFQKDMEQAGTDKKVAGMTFSEFGRRIVSNNSLGTDHGAAAPLFVFGTPVKGGMYGSPIVLPETATVDDNIPMQTDFRSVYASVLKNHLGASDDVVREVLQYDYPIIDFLH